MIPQSYRTPRPIISHALLNVHHPVTCVFYLPWKDAILLSRGDDPAGGRRVQDFQEQGKPGGAAMPVPT